MAAERVKLPTAPADMTSLLCPGVPIYGRIMREPTIVTKTTKVWISLSLVLLRVASCSWVTVDSRALLSAEFGPSDDCGAHDRGLETLEAALSVFMGSRVEGSLESDLPAYTVDGSFPLSFTSNQA